MGEAFRRIFLKPPDLTDEESARLAKGLAEAVGLQRQLATKSPHVLEPTSGLQEDDRLFYVEHEPALAIPLAEFFDSTAPTAGPEEVLLVAVALADALRVTHLSGQGRAAVHGGLSAGVLLRSSDGIIKIADFGIAAEVCAALGVERYLNLAVGSDVGQATQTADGGADSPLHTTGAWEILSPDEYERDDRICGFIDPQKYGSGTLATFEPGSDMISAGFLLHLLAEHRHPYLDDPEEARMVELSEDMATRLYNGARRKDFRESEDPRIQVWCKVVAAMLSRLPKERPSAGELATAFSEVGVKPADAATLIEGQLNALARLAQTEQWEELRSKARAIAGSEEVTPEINATANSFVCLADAHDLLKRALESIAGDDWQRAKEVLSTLPNASELPGDFADQVAESAGEVRALVERNSAADDELDEIERQIPAAMEQDLTAAKSTLNALGERLKELPADDQLAANIAARRKRLEEQLRDTLESAEVILRSHAIALDWLGKLQNTRNQEQWDDVEQSLGARPEVEHWPPDALAEVDRITQQLADQVAGAEWVALLRLAVEEQDWDEADQVYKDKPEGIHWPKTLEADAGALAARLLEAGSARKHLAELEQAVEAKNWNEANRIIQARPNLDHWPSRILEQEASLTRGVEEKLKETADQYAAANAWASKLEAACEKELWPEVEQSLAARPQIEQWPQDVLEREVALNQRFADQARARDHVDRLGAAVEAEEWKNAEGIRKKEPHLAYWPRSLRAETDNLVKRMGDATEANKWITRLDEAVDSGDWDAAAEVLTDRPGLAHWPATVLAEEESARKAIEGHVTADREARGLLRSAEEAAEKEAIEQALKILDSIFARSDYFPSKRIQEAKKKRKVFTASLKEKRRRQLEDREQQVKDLAAQYVQELVSKTLAKYVHPDIVDTSVDGLQWDSAAAASKEDRQDDLSAIPEEQTSSVPSTGRAAMSVSVRATSGRDQESVSGSEFSFELTTQPPRVCDDRGAIRQQLTDELMGFVKKVQKKQAAALTKPLREGMFPDAQIAMKLDKAVQRIDVTVYLLGAEAPEHRVDTELVWDNTTLTFNFVDAFSFTRQVVEIVVGRASELVGRKLLEGSELLRKYGSVLTFGVAPPAVADDAGIPDVLALEGWLAIRKNGNGDGRGTGLPAGRPLLTFPVLCPQVGTVQVDADLTPAETSLRDIVVAGQNSARATIEDELKTQIKAAPAKGKLVALTKRIKSPIDSLQFEVKGKRGERLPLTADWNIETFKFDVPKDMRAKVEEFLSITLPPTRPTDPSDQKSPAVIEGKVSTESQTPDAPRPRPRRRAVAVGSVLLLAAVAVGVAALWPNRGTRNGNEDDNTTPSPIEASSEPTNETKNAGVLAEGGESESESESKPVVSPEPTTTRTLTAVRDVMSDPQNSRHLAEHVGDEEYANDFIWEVTDEAGELSGVGYRVPGLEILEPLISVQLTDDEYSVSKEELDAVTGAVQELDPLLDKVAERVTRLLAENPQTTFIDSTRLIVRQNAKWVVDDDRKSWSARGAELTIVFTPALESAENAGAENTPPEVELARHVTNLALIGGKVSPSEGELVNVIENGILQGVQVKQAESLQLCMAYLRDQTANIDGVEVTPTDPLDELRQAVNLSVTAPGLAEREFSLAWDPQRLNFDSETLQGAIDEITSAHGALTRMKDEIAGTEAHWLRELLGDPGSDLIELRQPTTDEWVLGLTGPWAEPGSIAPRRLPIRVTLDPGASGEERLNNLTLEPPAYWELITRLVALENGLEENQNFLAQADNRATLVEGLEDLEGVQVGRMAGLIQYVDQAPVPAYVIPYMELVEEPVLRWDAGDQGTEAAEAEPNAVELSLLPGFVVKLPAEAGADGAADPLANLNLDYLNNALAEKLREVTQAAEIPNCTLSLTLAQSDGAATQVVGRWSDLAGAVEGLALMVGDVRDLNRQIDSLAIRAGVESELGEAMQAGGFEPLKLDPPQAYEFLKRIWEAKGSGTLLKASLEDFSTTQQIELKKQFLEDKRHISPTIFIEYFSGPEWTFALAWSVKRPVRSSVENTIPEGPFLLRVCPTDLLQQAPDTDTGGDVGGLLFDPVLDKLGEAVASARQGLFSSQLGLAVAYDLWMPGAKELPTLGFTARSSYLEPADAEGAGYPGRLPWTSLAQLRESSKACDFVLLGALSDSRPRRETASDEAVWAAGTARRALRKD